MEPDAYTLVEAVETQAMRQGQYCKQPDNWKEEGFDVTPIDWLLNQSNDRWREGHKPQYSIDDVYRILCFGIFFL